MLHFCAQHEGTSRMGHDKYRHGGERGMAGDGGAVGGRQERVTASDAHALRSITWGQTRSLESFSCCGPVSSDGWNHKLRATSGHVLAPDVRELAVPYIFCLLSSRGLIKFTMNNESVLLHFRTHCMMAAAMLAVGVIPYGMAAGEGCN
jgi:hypothetical protein